MDHEKHGNRRIEARFANHFRIGFNRDQVVIDVGDAFQGDEMFFWRIICGPPYARALSTVLHESLSQYEEQYGRVPEPEGS